MNLKILSFMDLATFFECEMEQKMIDKSEEGDIESEDEDYQSENDEDMYLIFHKFKNF